MSRLRLVLGSRDHYHFRDSIPRRHQVLDQGRAVDDVAAAIEKEQHRVPGTRCPYDSGRDIIARRSSRITADGITKVSPTVIAFATRRLRQPATGEESRHDVLGKSASARSRTPNRGSSVEMGAGFMSLDMTSATTWSAMEDSCCRTYTIPFLSTRACAGVSLRHQYLLAGWRRGTWQTARIPPVQHEGPLNSGPSYLNRAARARLIADRESS